MSSLLSFKEIEKRGELKLYVDGGRGEMDKMEKEEIQLLRLKVQNTMGKSRKRKTRWNWRHRR
ncbi:hypothetical protein XC23_11020 [Clostridioides difficile]|uniref:hypothetical protein n=1 Tax=Clostridioides difficile TaxID=1496 RepID=UPI0028A498D9|nr:hypothetical protein [Clostridioides difficile]KAK2214642.1 hypothetical protein XC23_11020 [Clostridioides difficile]